MHFSDRRRTIWDMLNDLLLTRDVERRYGDVSSLHDWIERWEGDDFAPLKNEGGDDSIKVGGKHLFPWITVANKLLFMLLVIALTFSGGPPVSALATVSRSVGVWGGGR